MSPPSCTDLTQNPQDPEDSLEIQEVAKSPGHNTTLINKTIFSKCWLEIKGLPLTISCKRQLIKPRQMITKLGKLCTMGEHQKKRHGK